MCASLVQRPIVGSLTLAFMVAAFGCTSDAPSAPDILQPPDFSATMYEGCDPGVAWQIDGTGHNPYTVPAFKYQGTSTTQCGNLGPGYVSFAWNFGGGTDALHSSHLQTTARIRHFDGTTSWEPVQYDAAMPMNPIWFGYGCDNPGVDCSGLVSKTFTAGSDVDAIVLVQHYGQHIANMGDWYFTTPFSIPDRNMYAQMWFAIPQPSGLTATNLGAGDVQLTWTNPRAFGPHYRTEVRVPGQPVLTLGVNQTSQVVSGIPTGQTTFGVRYVAEKPYPVGQGLIEPTSPEATVTFTSGITPDFDFACSGFFCFYYDSTQSQNPITSWSWSFGDGGVSALQNPTHNYTANGTYQVTLTVSDGTSSASITKPLTPVYQSLSAQIAGESIIRDDEACEFSASVTGGTLPYAYEWRRDGAVVSSASTYFGGMNGAQYFDLTLTVTDAGYGFQQDSLHVQGGGMISCQTSGGGKGGGLNP